MEKEKYFLTLRIQKGQEARIDISLLDIAKGYYPQSLKEIDIFTLNLTKNELLKEIDKANIADKYLEGDLCITSTKNIKPMPVLTKDYVNNFNIYNYLLENITNKKLMNNLINKFQNYENNENIIMNLKNNINNGNAIETFKIINNLDYIYQRKLLCYLIKNS